jgi:hypothetical protein
MLSRFLVGLEVVVPAGVDGKLEAVIMQEKEAMIDSIVSTVVTIC